MNQTYPFYAGTGSISSGTLREEDLIPEFIWCAKHLRLTRAERKQVTEIERESRKDGYFGSDECGFDLNETLFDILNNHALPYFYFGSHPGDGADFGYWLSEESIEEFGGLKVSDTSEVPKGYIGEVLHVNDHGNMTLYSCSRGRMREVWGIV